MKFTYCPDCGTLLESRTLGDEGAVPWCFRCNKPWFPMFSTCIIVLVHDRQGHALLLRQNYIHPVYRNLVSGYMTPGETAEETARREILEETGLEVTDLKLIGTWWFARKDMLMIGFFAEADSNSPLRLSTEVDGASWHSADEALTLVHPEGSVSHALVKSFRDLQE